jgi:hypothetical protein
VVDITGAATAGTCLSIDDSAIYSLNDTQSSNDQPALHTIPK